MKKRRIILVDHFLIAGLLCMLLGDKSGLSDHLWQTAHCWICFVWLLLMGWHVKQHWTLIKAFTQWRVVVRNKITALTIAAFALISMSVVLLITGSFLAILQYHNLVAHGFMGIIIVHLLTKLKRLVDLQRTVLRQRKPVKTGVRFPSTIRQHLFADIHPNSAENETRSHASRGRIAKQIETPDP